MESRPFAFFVGILFVTSWAGSLSLQTMEEGVVSFRPAELTPAFRLLPVVIHFRQAEIVDRSSTARGLLFDEMEAGCETVGRLPKRLFRIHLEASGKVD